MHERAKEYIDKLHLEAHPEGGYFREIYRSGELILPEHLPTRYKSSRSFSTSIYFMLEGKQFSSFHRLQSDELWHFYDGSSLIVYIIDEKAFDPKMIFPQKGHKIGYAFWISVFSRYK